MYRPSQLVEMEIASCEARFISARDDFNSEGGSAFDRQRMKDAGDEKNAWKAVQNLMELGRHFENPRPVDNAPRDRRILLRHPLAGWITGQWSEVDQRWSYSDVGVRGKIDEKQNQPLVYLELPQ